MMVEHTGKQLEDGGHPPIQAVRPGTPLCFLHNQPLERQDGPSSCRQHRSSWFLPCHRILLAAVKADNCAFSSHLNLPMALLFVLRILSSLVFCHILPQQPHLKSYGDGFHGRLGQASDVVGSP